MLITFFSAEANSYIMTKATKALALLFELGSYIFKKAYIPRACRVVTRLHQCVEYLWAKRMSLPLKSYPQFLSVHILSTLAGFAAVFLNTGGLGNLPNSHFTFCGELLDISPAVVDLLIAILGVPVWSLRLLHKAETHKMQCTQSFHGDPGFVAKIVVYEPFSTKSCDRFVGIISPFEYHTRLTRARCGIVVTNEYMLIIAMVLQ